MANEPHDDRLLSGYRILDLADRKALLAGKVLGCLGADVIKIERPGGDPARRIGPFYKDQIHPEKSLYWFCTNTSKRGITLDIAHPDGKELFKRLVKTADAVVESFEPGYMASLGLGYQELCKVKPDIVVTSVSPYGQTGPYAHLKHSDLTTWSMGGQTYIGGEPNREPLQRYLHQADFHGGVQGAVGTLMALTHRDVAGEGQHVDVSIQQAVVLTLMNCVELYDILKFVYKRAGSDMVRPRSALPSLKIRTIYPCKDGHVATRGIFGAAKGNIEAALAIMKWAMPEGYLREIPDYDPRALKPDSIPQEEWDRIQAAVARFFLSKSKQEIMDRSATEGMQIAPCNTVADLWTSPNFLARGFWEQRVEHPELGDTFAYPGAPVRSAERFWRVSRRAPLIGEHNDEIYGGDLGLSREQLAALAAKGVISSRAGAETATGHAEPPRTVPDSSESLQVSEPLPACEEARDSSRRAVADPVAASDGPQRATSAEPYRRRGILTGVNVIDFSWVGAGPQVSRELANHGAQVIRIESHAYPCPLRLAPPFKDGIPGVNRSAFGMCFNTSKYSVCLRLDKPQGQDLAKRLITWADVMLQSMTSDVMFKFGLDYESVRAFKPDIIYYSTNQPGLVGPYRTFGGYGFHGAAYAGFEAVSGYRDLYPAGVPCAYTDFISPWYGIAFVLGALRRKRRTGKGTLLDQSQWEAGTNFLGPDLLDYVVNGRVATPLGNRDPQNCPQGVFPCRGDDRWVAIAVEDEQQWQAFGRVVAEPWTQDPRFATLSRRKENEDELERLVGEWTRNRVAEEVMRIIQAAGVPAGVVQSCEELVDHDPQLKHRRAFEWLEHQEIGSALHNTPAYRLSKTPHHLLKAGPIIGEDNEYVFREILGLGDDDIGDLYAEGVIDTEYDAPAPGGTQ